MFGVFAVLIAIFGLVGLARLLVALILDPAFFVTDAGQIIIAGLILTSASALWRLLKWGYVAAE